ncbi:hypothetical protein DEO72_LG10g1698 [Vigna unguiculata]|uniref:Uncharacterized protein n=1 Tax=Vigna unguiculata TaxID=3917 RepID=A0A4D6NAX5_VIGUN|nr:hypothetical protein DEO72_LG10g1698 [Vigna unguiculata]
MAAATSLVARRRREQRKRCSSVSHGNKRYSGEQCRCRRLQTSESGCRHRWRLCRKHGCVLNVIGGRT